MDEADIDLIPKILAVRGLPALNLTGGAPELHPRFRDLVQMVRGLGAKVIDRRNLTILSEPGQEDLAGFLAAQGLELVASLPCCLEDNVDRQRGKGVYVGLVVSAGHGGGAPHLRDLLRTDFGAAPIAVADHWYGCTAGQGSSCGGALGDAATP